LKGARAVWHNQAIPCHSDFSLNGNLGELERLAAGVSEFCAANSLGDDAEFELNLVLEELFVNAVRHGGCEGVPGAAHVHLRCAADGVEVGFRDRGRAFDPTAAPDADIHASLGERRGGLGIHLVRGIMRDLHYHRDGEWNQLRMRRAAGPVRESEGLKNS
jgi:anti-sigma regulatory factor (Ser/Thr protein kinase)